MNNFLKTYMNFWNERYATSEYAYGIEPNDFVKKELCKLKPGKVLFPAEGEGRNAVYAAQLGFEVYAFDPSEEGRRKALNLSLNNEVSINYQLAGYSNFEFPKNHFDGLVLIFAHMPPETRKNIHQNLMTHLKPGGSLILEGFSKEQINYNSGGPKDISMLFSEDELKSDFRGMKTLNITSTITTLSEGAYHNGEASVIRITGIK